MVPVLLLASALAIAQNEGEVAFGAKAAQAPAPYVIVKGTTRSIALEEEVGDLLVVDGHVEIAGVVRGHVFSIDSEVTVKSSAVVLSSMTIQRGSVRIEDGAVLPPAITIKDAKLFGPDGEIQPKHGEKAALGRAGTTIELEKTALSTASVALMKSVLPFERFSPKSSEIDQLIEWSPGLGLKTKMEQIAPKSMTIGGITKLSFVSGKIHGAMQHGFRGARGTVVFSVIELEDVAAAKSLWGELERAGQASKVSMSVKTALGGGAHWWFKKKNRFCFMWQQGHWFFAVETKLAADNATLYQEKQFSDQVVSRLKSELTSLESLAVPGGTAGPHKDHARGMASFENKSDDAAPDRAALESAQRQDEGVTR